MKFLMSISSADRELLEDCIHKFACCLLEHCFHPLNSLMLLTNPQYLVKQQQNPRLFLNQAGISDSLLS